MFEQLDELIKGYEDINLTEFWYDTGVEEAMEIIDEFDESDWDSLMESLPSKSVLWKQRLVRCIPAKDEEHNLKVLNELVKTDDLGLFDDAIHLLNRYDLESIENVDDIYRKIDEFMPQANNLQAAAFEKFLKKKEVARRI